jgi:hypothetical protein
LQRWNLPSFAHASLLRLKLLSNRLKHRSARGCTSSGLITKDRAVHADEVLLILSTSPQVVCVLLLRSDISIDGLVDGLQEGVSASLALRHTGNEKPQRSRNPATAEGVS